MISCETGKTPVESHFREVTKMAALGAGTQRPVRVYKLTRSGRIQNAPHVIHHDTCGAKLPTE